MWTRRRGLGSAASLVPRGPPLVPDCRLSSLSPWQAVGPQPRVRTVSNGSAPMNRILLFCLTALAAGMACAAPDDAGWPAYGGDAGGMRYSPLKQIDAANVEDLRVAWIFRTGELGQGVKDWSRSAFETTPILYQGTLYFTT